MWKSHGDLKAYTLVINNLNNNRETSKIFSVGEKYHSTDLHKPPLRSIDFNLCHISGSVNVDLVKVPKGLIKNT